MLNKYFLISSFSDFFGYSSLPISCFNTRFTTSDSNCYITNCYFFMSTTFDGFGGMIYIDGVSINFLIEESIFHNCKCSNRGGAIYFWCSSSGASVLNKICGFGCSAGIAYHLAALRTSNSKINQVLYTSMNKCSDNFNVGDENIRTYNGLQKINNNNISFNKGRYYSGFDYVLPSEIVSKFNNFVENNSSIGICVAFEIGTSIIDFELINLIQNYSPNSYGIIYSSYTTTLNNFCFINNFKLLFSIPTNSLNIYNSYIQHDMNFFSSGNLNTFNINFLEKKFIFTYFSTYLCNTNFLKSNNKKLKYNFYYLIIKLILNQ